MPENARHHEFLAACSVDPQVLELRPDYRAGLVIVGGLATDGTAGDVAHDADRPAEPGAIDELIAAAEAHARSLLAGSPVEELPHVAAWRDAYRAFGAKPQRTRNSLEALTRRAEAGLPRVNPLTDVYNAISVLHQVPIGGEEFDAYRGPARLVRAHGNEPFDTVASGEPAIEHPEPGEVVWRDDAGVTCRRWNWRQGRRTALTGTTGTAFFILDALAPLDDAALVAAEQALVAALPAAGAELSVARRTIGASS